MADFHFEYDYFSIKGTMPSGEVRKFATIADYKEAYDNEVNEIVDEMARLHYNDEPIDYPDHEWLVYA